MFEFKKNISKLIILGVVIGLLIFLHFAGFLAPVENVIKNGFKYVQEPIYRAGQTVFKSKEKLSQEQLENENSDLKKQVELYTVEISRLKKKIEDEESFNKQLEFLEKNEFRSVGAKIIGKTVDGQSQVYLLNQGKSVGIKENFPVITENGILLGKILEANENTSKILLLTSNLSKIGAQVQNKNQSQGVVSGQHGLTARMDLIAKDEPVNKYDIIVSSGLEENIPEGLVIGQVEDIESRDSELFKSAIISPLIDFRNQSIVSVIIP